MIFSRATSAIVGFGVCAAVLIVLGADVPARAMPYHIPTWTYDGSYGGQTDGTTSSTTNATSKARIQTWVTFAEAGDSATQKAFLDCSAVCAAIVYFDPFKKYNNCSSDVAFINAVNGVENAWYHQYTPISSANRIQVSSALGCGSTAAYFANGANLNTELYWQSWVRSRWAFLEAYGGGGMSDDANNWCTVFNSTTPSTIPYELGAASTCTQTHTGQIGALFSAMTWNDGRQFPVFFNHFAANSAYQILTDLSELKLPAIAGGIGEGFVLSGINGTTIFPRAVSSLLDTLSLVNNLTTKRYVMLAYIKPGLLGPCAVLAHAWYNNCSELQQRRFALGVIWLGYKDWQEILWDETKVSTSIQVFPEVSLYPVTPLQTMSTFSYAGTNGSGCGAVASIGGAATLRVACGILSDGTPDGVYRREFAACYNFGAYVGPCAVVLNTTASPVVIQPAWLSQQYGHFLTMSYGDVVVAGCGISRCPPSALNPSGGIFVAGTTQLAPVDAIFLFP